MGHRFSKTPANNIAATTRASNGEASSTINTTTTTTTNSTSQKKQSQSTTTTRTIPIPPNGSTNFVGPTINFQIQESPTAAPVNSTCCNTTSTSSSSSLASTATAAVVTAHNNILQQPLSTGGGVCGGCSSNSSLTSVNNLSCGRQIIIKIQLAKMENGNDIQQGSSLENITADCNLNSSELYTTTAATTMTTTATSNAGAAQILNFNLNGSSASSGNSTGGSCHSHIMTSTPSTDASSILRRTAGSSPPLSSLTSSSMVMPTTNNNYLNRSRNSNFSSSMDAPTMALTERLGRLNTLQFNDEIVEQNIGDIVEYCEVLEEQHHPQQLPTPPLPPMSHGQMATEEPEAVETYACCRRKSKSLAANGGASNVNAKRRCRKCSCRDAFRRILDPSLSRSSNKAQKQQQQLERKEQNSKLNKSQERHSISHPISTSRNPISTNNTSMMPPQRNSIHSTLVVPTPSGATAAAMMAAAAAATSSSVSAAAAASTNQLAVWAPVTTMSNGSDVIIPLTTPPQFVVVQCAIVNPSPPHHPANSSATTSGMPPPNSIISITHDPSTSHTSNNEIMVKVPMPHTSSQSSSLSTNGGATIMGPIVHSQVDFVHYLVPDLERITNSSFYWGKMDRYEAERLLEGKPEGTFLLRDSAQEEFLFSVTFRKYGRSLHARIEQSGHQFSFDCHDPCVFTAPTVTGLLEHYKDPACVMFFEPMLTIPLHRKNCFSLQKLCRATIVSNTTYDGINELELPARLKSYLKEYHYKQKLRVKSTEPTYTIHCK